MNLTLFMQVLPKAGLGWLGVFAVTIIMSDLPNNSETVSIGGDLPTMGILKGR